MSSKHSRPESYTKCSIVSVIRTRDAILGQLQHCIKLLHYSRGFVPLTQPSSSQRLRNALTVRYILNLVKLYLLEVEQTISLFYYCDKYCFQESENQETARGRRFQMRQFCSNDFFKNYVKNLKREVKTIFFKFLDEPETLLECTEMQLKLEFRLKLLQVAVIVLKKETCSSLKLDDENACENPLAKFSAFHTSFSILNLPLSFDSVCSFL